jgi:hypothetical protein
MFMQNGRLTLQLPYEEAVAALQTGSGSPITVYVQRNDDACPNRPRIGHGIVMNSYSVVFFDKTGGAAAPTENFIQNKRRQTKLQYKIKEKKQKTGGQSI